MYNASDYPNIAMTPSSMVANGTLASGFSGVDWLCLADGCYEIVVDGGAADSEIGFEFVDEVGGHFQDFSAPYADHMCVSGGDVFDHPTASPTPLPIAASDGSLDDARRRRCDDGSRRRRRANGARRRSRRRSRRRPIVADDATSIANDVAADDVPPTTAQPTTIPTPVPYPVPTVAGCTNGVLDTAHGEADVDCGGAYCPACGIGAACAVADDCSSGWCVGATCAAAPTALPTSAPTTPSPTPLPTPAPTRTPVVQVSLGLSGIDCDDFDQTVYDEACGAVLSNATFEDAACALYADGTGVTLTSEVRVALAVIASLYAGSPGEHTVHSHVMTTLEAAVSDGSFTTAIQTAAARRRLAKHRRAAAARRAAAVDGERAGRLGRGRDILANARAVAAAVDTAVARAVAAAVDTAVDHRLRRGCFQRLPWLRRRLLPTSAPTALPKLGAAAILPTYRLRRQVRRPSLAGGGGRRRSLAGHRWRR